MKVKIFSAEFVAALRANKTTNGSITEAQVEQMGALLLREFKKLPLDWDDHSPNRKGLITSIKNAHITQEELQEFGRRKDLYASKRKTTAKKLTPPVSMPKAKSYKRKPSPWTDNTARAVHDDTMREQKADIS